MTKQKQTEQTGVCKHDHSIGLCEGCNTTAGRLGCPTHGPTVPAKGGKQTFEEKVNRLIQEAYYDGKYDPDFIARLSG